MLRGGRFRFVVNVFQCPCVFEYFQDKALGRDEQFLHFQILSRSVRILGRGLAGGSWRQGVERVRKRTAFSATALSPATSFLKGRLKFTTKRGIWVFFLFSLFSFLFM